MNTIAFKPLLFSITVCMFTLISGGYVPAQAVPENVRCDEYAKRAVAQNEQNKRGKCGYAGAQWNSGFDSHKNWCMQNPASVAKADHMMRIGKLGQCRRVDRPSGADKWCSTYSKKAIEQNSRMNKAGCPVPFNAMWNSNFMHHYNWCVERPKGASQTHLKRREILIKKCIKSDR